ncbi:MAG: LytR C-terminal domain-containing protein [Methylotenera sp.]
MMKSKQKILPAVCCIALLSACASNQSASVAPWTITPTTTTSHGSNSVDAMYKMGRYYQGQNRYDLAISAYQKALAADNGFVEARNGLGVIYSRQGKYREAIEAFQVAVQQSPKAAHLYSNMGYAYYLQGQYAESVTALEQATLLDPTNQRALNNLGLAYAKAGSKGESVQAFAQAANAATTTPDAVTKVADPMQGKLQIADQTADIVAVLSTSLNVQPELQPELQPQPEVQMLTLPKDRGVIRSAPNTIAVVDSRVQLVELSANVSELRMQPYSAEPVQTVATDVADLKKLRIEVANGNGATGAARKVGRFLGNLGYPTARLTNQKPFKVRMTQIQYREGYQAEAQLLQASLPDTHALVQRDDMRAGVSVRLVLGKDMVTQLAHYEYNGKKTYLALN